VEIQFLLMSGASINTVFRHRPRLPCSMFRVN
jgi:hypothetical protein